MLVGDDLDEKTKMLMAGPRLGENVVKGKRTKSLLFLTEITK